MPPNTLKLGSGKVLHSQAREVIYNVYKFMKNESICGVIDNLKKVQQRVCNATGISERSLRKILHKAKDVELGTTSFTTPGKKRPNSSKKFDLDDFDKSVVRRTIHNFHKTNNENPTIKKIHAKLVEDIDFKGSLTTLRRIVKRLGFRWKKTEDNRQLLIEKHEIRLLRLKFISQIKEYRREGRPIVYTDETYVHSSHTKPCSWSDGSKEGLKAPISKGKRLIVVHAGSKDGFVPNAGLIFQSDKKTGDYHSEMNFNNYSKWLFDKLIPNLPPRSVLVMDNASYHNMQYDKAPTSSSRKHVLQEWLTKKNIPYSPNMLKSELYELVLTNKGQNKHFQIDRILANYGHTVLRLPPYHPELNPIEKIWALVKDYVAQNNVTFKLDDAKRILEEKFALVSAEEWRARCEHAIKKENEFMANEQLVDDLSERIIINLQDDSDSDNSDTINEDSDDNDLDGDLEGIQPLSPLCK